MEAKIFCEKPLLLQTLRRLRLVKAEWKKKKAISCEMVITEGRVLFSVPGAEFSMECKTEGSLRASLGFLYFYDIIFNLSEKIVEMTFTEGAITINQVTVKANTEFISDNNGGISKLIQLPYNYTENNILKLILEGLTEDEIKFQKLEAICELVISKYRTSTSKALKHLTKYGVTKEDVEEMVKRRLI